MKNDEKIIFRLAKIDDAEKLVEIYAPYVKNTNITFEYKNNVEISLYFSLYW